MLLRLQDAQDIPQVWHTLQGMLREIAQPGLSATITVQVGAMQVDPSAALNCDVLIRLEPVRHLTPAERALVNLVRQGLSNGEIAAQLGKSIRTVKGQLTSIYRKLGVRSRSRLLAQLR